MSARIAETASGIRLSIPDWNIEQQLSSNLKEQGGATAVLALIMDHFGVTDRGYDIHVRSRIPIAMGLGSSAALAVAIIRAFDKLAGKGMSDADVEALAFECEKISHGTPSGIDNNIATYGEAVLYTKSARSRTKRDSITTCPSFSAAHQLSR